LEVLVKAVKDDVKRCEKAVRHTVVEGNTELTRKNGWLGVFTSGGAGNTDIKENKTGGVDKKPKRTTPPPGIGVLFGTHNWNSCGLVLKNLVDAGLAVSNDDQELNPEAVGDFKIIITDEVVERIVIAQHYGMCDDLTDWVMKNTVSNTPFVIKYVPYGTLADVGPSNFFC